MSRYWRDRSIFNKLLWGYLLLTLALTILIVVTSYVVIHHSFINSSKIELMDKAKIMADIFTEESKGDPAYVRMRNIENLTEAQVIYVGQDMVARRIQRLGERTNDEDKSLELSRIIDALDLQLVASILSGKSACDIREVEFMGGQVMFAGAPVYAPDHSVAGAAILYRPFEEIRGMAWDLAWLIMLACLVAGSLTIMLSYILSRRLVKPILALTKTAQRMAAGHYGEPVQLNQGDEIGVLGGALGHLSFRLKGVISDLRDEKSKLEQILSGIGEGIVAVDQNGSVVHYNTAALELLEISEWSDHPTEDAPHQRELIKLLQQIMDGRLRDEAVWKNAAGRSIAARIWAITSEENTSIGAVALLSDVSEAERLEQMRRDYVANISHELRTPLTGIRGMTEPLLDGYMDTEEEKMECYRIIYQETLRLEKLIGEMLDMSRLQAGRAQIELEPMSIEGVLDAAQRRMRERAQEGGILLHQEISSDLPQVMGNEDRILQVLIILLDNALSFTPSGGSITLFAYRRCKQIILGVRDTGAGIDPKDLPYIWERFYKADRSRMRTTGTGLGLAIAKLVVECMNGTISVKSEVGKGSEFEFSLHIAS